MRYLIVHRRTSDGAPPERATLAARLKSGLRLRVQLPAPSEETPPDTARRPEHTEAWASIMNGYPERKGRVACE